MARANLCKRCGSTEGPWVGTNHNLCQACVDAAAAREYRNRNNTIVWLEYEGLLRWGRYSRRIIFTSMANGRRSLLGDQPPSRLYSVRQLATVAAALGLSLTPNWEHDA